MFLDAWAALCADAGVDAAAGAAVGEDLFARHSEPQRHYHAVEHIEAVLGHLDALGAATVVARFTAFFHDAIYDPTAPDNEERSAVLAEETLGGLGVDREVVAAVATITRATAGHGLPDDAPPETAAFLDADLAMFGSPAAVYDRDVVNIRAEYAHVSDADWRVGRARVLRSFADREILYLTPEGRELWDAQARLNLAGELATLESEPS